MADNTIIIGGATQPSTINTPGDKRERVKVFDEIYSIDNPAVGGTVWVEEEQKEYRIISLKPKVIGGMEIADGMVNEVVPEAEIISRGLKLDGESLAEAIAEDTGAVNALTGAIVKDETALNTIAGAISQKTTYDEETGKLVLL